MVSLILLRPFANKFLPPRLKPYGLKLYSTKTSKPLRILFCGSDEFSIASLRAIHAEHKRDPQLIRSIDVLCRPGKPAGRSLKQIREVPIKDVAQELGLPLHERDTFTGWDLPRPNDESINLIVAVSFGLFVPSRILKAAEYGGLNVHPSLLPNFRGPAPLQHMIIRRQKAGGVTLQTLDEKSFDHGKILAQDYFDLPQETMTYQKLLDFVMPKAAEILVSGLQNRLFVPPLVEDTRWRHMIPQKLIHASKVTPRDRKIYWRVKSAATDIPRRHKAFGRLWFPVLVDPKTPKRIILEDSETVLVPKILKHARAVETNGQYRARVAREIGHSIYYFVDGAELPQPVFYIEDGPAVIFRTPVKAIRVKRVTVEGQETKDASKAMKSIQRPGAWDIIQTEKHTRPIAFQWEVKDPALREVAATPVASSDDGAATQTTDSVTFDSVHGEEEAKDNLNREEGRAESTKTA